jgi:hypothetical protein
MKLKILITGNRVIHCYIFYKSLTMTSLLRQDYYYYYYYSCYIYNRPRPYRYSNMSSSNLAIHIKQSSFGINNIHKLAHVWSKYNYS